MKYVSPFPIIEINDVSRAELATLSQMLYDADEEETIATSISNLLLVLVKGGDIFFYTKEIDLDAKPEELGWELITKCEMDREWQDVLRLIMKYLDQLYLR